MPPSVLCDMTKLYREFLLYSLCLGAVKPECLFDSSINWECCQFLHLIVNVSRKPLMKFPTSTTTDSIELGSIQTHWKIKYSSKGLHSMVQRHCWLFCNVYNLHVYRGLARDQEEPYTLSLCLFSRCVVRMTLFVTFWIDCFCTLTVYLAFLYNN